MPLSNHLMAITTPLPSNAMLLIIKFHGLRTPPASLHSRQRSHCSENKHSTWRQEFLGCGSENLEQSTRLTAAA